MLTCVRFGWVNASYVYGLQIVSAHMKRALGTLTAWEDYARATSVILEDNVSVLSISESIPEASPEGTAETTPTSGTPPALEAAPVPKALTNPTTS